MYFNVYKCLRGLNLDGAEMMYVMLFRVLIFISTQR